MSHVSEKFVAICVAHPSITFHTSVFRSFSVKRFKRKKSEKMLRPKETLIIHPHAMSPSVKSEDLGTSSVLAGSVNSLAVSPGTKEAGIDVGDYEEVSVKQGHDGDEMEVDGCKESENNYEEVKAQYKEIKYEVSRLESQLAAEDRDADIEGVEKRYSCWLVVSFSMVTIDHLIQW